MKGKILDFSIQTNSGIITGEDNKRYQFVGSEWKEHTIPQRGIEVDFDCTEDAKAIGVYVALESTSITQPNQSNPLHPASPMQTVNTQANHQPASPLPSHQHAVNKPVAHQTTDLTAEANYSAFHWFIKCMKHYVNFNGRARRKEFWFFQMVSTGITLVLSGLLGGVALLFTLAVLLPSIAVSARRLHDTGRSGWLSLVGLIPVVGILVLIYWWAQDSQQQPNAFGVVPK